MEVEYNRHNKNRIPERFLFEKEKKNFCERLSNLNLLSINEIILFDLKSIIVNTSYEVMSKLSMIDVMEFRCTLFSYDL